MHPLLIMLAITAGGEIGGLVGLLLAVPILVVLKVAIIHAKSHLIRGGNKGITSMIDPEY